MATGETVLGYAENYLSFDRSDIGLPGAEEAQLLQYATQAVREYHNAHTKNGGEPNSILQREEGYNSISSTNLNGALSEGATTITVDSASSFASSGVVAIWDHDKIDFAAYTGTTSTTFTGVTGVDFDHDDDDVVEPTYALPSDFHSFRSTHDNYEGVTVDGLPYTYTSGTPKSREFSVYDDGTTKYLVFPRDLSGDIFVSYNKSPTVIDETTDTVDVPDEDLWFVVWRIVEPVVETLGLEFAKSQLARQRADIILSEALKRRNIGKKPRFGRKMRVGRYRDYYYYF